MDDYKLQIIIDGKSYGGVLKESTSSLNIRLPYGEPQPLSPELQWDIKSPLVKGDPKDGWVLFNIPNTPTWPMNQDEPLTKHVEGVGHYVNYDLRGAQEIELTVIDSFKFEHPKSLRSPWPQSGTVRMLPEFDLDIKGPKTYIIPPEGE